MNEDARTELKRCELKLAKRTGLNALLLWLAVVGGLWAFFPREAAGVLLGGGLTLFFLAIHLSLAQSWLRPGPRRWVRLYLWGVWLVKWPLVVALLWFGIKTEWASPIGLCLGAAIIPLTATAMALFYCPPRRVEDLA